jgi:lipid II:glycine glycyltransferase (peptidoglycan interpeptide bridge formation enzyme)
MENSAEDILASMHEKGRYNIRLAQKRGVHIEAVSPTEENLDIWMNLVRETTIRDSFS